MFPYQWKMGVVSEMGRWARTRTLRSGEAEGVSWSLGVVCMVLQVVRRVEINTGPQEEQGKAKHTLKQVKDREEGRHNVSEIIRDPYWKD